MEILKPKQGFLILSSLLFVCNLSVWTIHALGSIPARFDGFVYKNYLPLADSIMIEAFFDPVCPDSRDAWPPLKRVLEYYGPRLSLIVHPFSLPDAWPPLKRVLKHYGPQLSLIVHPFALLINGHVAIYEGDSVFYYSNQLSDYSHAGLAQSVHDSEILHTLIWNPNALIDFFDGKCSYHDNAFVTSRALHIINKLNASATYHLMEQFFKHQEKFYNQQTFKMSRASVVDHIVKFVTKAVGDGSLLSAVETGFSDRNTDLATRVSFKYGCSRGVTGTPYFFVNGFPLPNAGSAVDYDGWRSIIDPLINMQRQSSRGIIHWKI